MLNETFPESYSPSWGTPEWVRLAGGITSVALASVIFWPAATLSPSPKAITAPVATLFVVSGILTAVGLAAICWCACWQEYQVHRRLVEVRKQWFDYAKVAELVTDARRHGSGFELVSGGNPEPRIRFSAATCKRQRSSVWTISPGEVINVRMRGADDLVDERLKQRATRD